MLKIGLIDEMKIPLDSRVALTPLQCVQVQNAYNVEIVVAPSAHRCFSNDEYLQEGVKLQEDLSDCDILLGIKEVPPEALIPQKQYLFFSHTIKKQEYNRPLMHALIEKKITMIDYELLIKDGIRVIGFGFFAGVVGAHYGLWTFGKKHDAFHLLPAHISAGLEDMTTQYETLNLPNIKIILTGSGRVASGLSYVMEKAKIQKVTPEDFLSREFNSPVYSVLDSSYLYEHKLGEPFLREDFHQHPERYKSCFLPYAAEADILLNGVFWNEKIDPLFETADISKDDFNLSVISDVTCDIQGSIPINIEISTSANPVYGFDRKRKTKSDAFQDSKDIIDIIAINNLPNELPRDASQAFGEDLIEHVVPELMKARSEMLEAATICKNGKLNPQFKYLSDYAYR